MQKNSKCCIRLHGVERVFVFRPVFSFDKSHSPSNIIDPKHDVRSYIAMHNNARLIPRVSEKQRRKYWLIPGTSASLQVYHKFTILIGQLRERKKQKPVNGNAQALDTPFENKLRNAKRRSGPLNRKRPTLRSEKNVEIGAMGHLNFKGFELRNLHGNANIFLVLVWRSDR